MRRLLTIALAAALGGVGCTSAGKKPAAPAGTTGRDRAPDSTPFWDESRPARVPGSGGAKADGPPREADGLIAGMLIDNAGRPQPNAIVNVTAAEAGPGAKPVGVQADDQGYFMIKGLRTGGTYFLSVRGEDAGKVLGGSAMAQAPNTRLLIRLSEGGVTSVTPPPVAHPGDTGPFAPDKKDGKTKLDPPANSVPSPDPVPKDKDPLYEGADQSWGPGKTPPASRPIVAPPPPATPPANPNITDVVKPTPPTVTIPGPGPRVEPPPPPAAPMMSAAPSNSSPLVGAPARARPAQNFTMYNLAGDPVEFRTLTDRRLVVIDFWTTSCLPCLRKIPSLIDFQSRYGDYVEVAALACDELPWKERKRAVEGIKDYYLRKTPRPINYNIYLEGDREEGKLRRQFKIEMYPTLVLLDHTGKELWRGSDVRQLEEAVKYVLRRP
jgi:thiol-disulfide isomerase/thioredoxin